MMPVEKEIHDLLRDTCRALVTNPEAVTVRTELLHRTMEADIEVLPIDCGLIIGKQGKTFSALAQVFKAYAKKHGLGGKLNRLQEPKERKFADNSFVASDWKSKGLEQLLKRLGQAVFVDSEAVQVERLATNGRVRLTLAVAGTESAVLVNEMHEHLDHLVGAMARVCGGTANVDIRIKEAEAQPQTAAGRFTKEIK